MQNLNIDSKRIEMYQKQSPVIINKGFNSIPNQKDTEKKK